MKVLYLESNFGGRERAFGSWFLACLKASMFALFSLVQSLGEGRWARWAPAIQRKGKERRVDRDVKIVMET